MTRTNPNSTGQTESRMAAATVELGRPIPDDPHAVSVCLPTWADNVGYEEADPRVIGRMQAGYPRFFLHPAVVRLFQACERDFAGQNECCFAFPSHRVAERCVDYVRGKKGLKARIDPAFAERIFVVTAPADARETMKSYWQHTGQIVSSRTAERLLGEAAPNVATAHGEEAKQTIRRRLAHLMNVEPGDVWLFPSGMAAIETAFRAFQKLCPAGKSVQFGFPYVDSMKVQECFAASTQFYPRGDADEIAALQALAAADPILGLFCEFPGNPLLASPDLPRLDELSRLHRFPILVDDTLGALVNVDVLPATDIVSTSLTKFFSGAGDVMGGSLILSSGRPNADRLREALADEYEDLLFGEDAVVLERNSRDCVERVRRINQTTEKLCDVLRAHPAVARIDFPKYRTPDQYRAFLRPGGGFGGLFSILLQDAEKSSPRFFDALNIAKGPNLGTNFSLCCPYVILAHYNELEVVERCGISRHLLRVSVGLEDADWLIAQFLSALSVISE